MCTLIQATNGFLTMQGGARYQVASTNPTSNCNSNSNPKSKTTSSSVVAGRPGGGCTPNPFPGGNPFPEEDHPYASWAGTLGTIAGTLFKYSDALL